MEDRDKIQALWLNLAIILNQLEELGEDPHTTSGDAAVFGESARVCYDPDTKVWEVTAS